MTTVPDLSMPADTDPYARVAAYYDVLHINPGSTALVDFFAGLAHEGMHALEIGPGTGRMTLPVAARVASLHCLERSAAMRTVLLTKLIARPELRGRVTVLDAAAPDIRPERRFDYIYLAAVLDGVPPQARRQFFAGLAERLAPGGVLATDMVHDEDLPDTAEHLIREARQGDCTYTLSTAVRPLGRDLADVRHVYRSYYRDDLVGTEIFDRRHHLHRPPDVVADLRAVGLEAVGGSAVAGPDAALADKGTLVAKRATRS
jgi:trans-aconitate methyltransferase